TAVAMVFGPDGVRTPLEQEKLAKSAREPEPASDQGRRACQPRMDYASDGLVIGNTFAKRADVVKVLADSGGEPPVAEKEDPYETATFRVPVGMKERMRRASSAAGLTIHEANLRAWFAMFGLDL